MEEKRLGPIRVAVVGSGMAGLVTAYLLRRDARQRYEVKVFESGTTLSLDSASISIPNGSQGSKDRVDLPMRAFAGGYYNNLKAMYDHLGVKYHEQPFLFEFAKAGPEEHSTTSHSYFAFGSNFHSIPFSRSSPLATFTYLIEALYLLVCYSWFSFCCFCIRPKITRQGTAYEFETLAQYLTRIWLPDYFTSYYLLPLMSSVATCSHQALLSFPASDLVDYKRRTNGAPHYTVSNGVQTVQERLANSIEYELSAIVTDVRQRGGQVQVTWERSDGNGDSRSEVFDKVVLAVTPDVVGKIYQPLSYHMSRIPTMQVESVVHTDRALLQTELVGRDTSQLIYLRTSTDNTHRTESLHVQPSGAIVTTCPFSHIDASLTLRSAKFTRVLRSPASKRIVNSIFEGTCLPTEEEKPLPSWKNGDDNVWLVGGWCWDGMVLLEGCVVSAMRVAKALDVEIPWLD
ncbi:FAD/NAD(P)-binding domain-containing protein [Sporormia fimetaria CBS 119925]|uniref:FAD/NAD(P)-binding domain-containing protein n=1 Tax=Sporormia fimetaria CBS 119925 TaxID=1340428 RepID=A0A6A6V2L5_9PLEO|nr:FAD/NAD(P)-binding domain-containing protein [Sporormia fimetaria CBS 119925]